jgi:alcohol dehydrogenase
LETENRAHRDGFDQAGPMTPFTLAHVPAIAFGAGRIAGLGKDVTEIAGDAARVLVVADPGVSALGLTAGVAAAIEADGHTAVVFDDIRSNPKEAQGRAAIDLARSEAAVAVVCVGGGSALEAGKLIAATARCEDDVTAFRLAAKPLPASGLPKICIPTTAGTGSETTAVSVLSDDNGVKFWYWGREIKADRVVVDPELTVALPAHLTAATGIDALVHAIEACTNRNAFSANDVYGREAIRLVVRHLATAVSEPGNLEARGGMLLAAGFAGIAIDNAGTALAHNIGHALGSLIPIHHGRAVAVAMAATLSWSVGGNEGGFVKIAEILGLGRDPQGLAAWFDRFVHSVGINTSLADEAEGIDAAVLARWMAAPENAAMRAANVRPVTDKDLQPLAEMVLGAR